MNKVRSIIKKLILKTVPLSVQRLIINNTLQAENIDIANIHFSQEGEDVILDKFFFDKQAGFYVDIGAHHPIKLSNTYKYYLRGWRGLNIDAMPGSMSLFKEIRPRDINIEVGVSSKKGNLPFYVFSEPTLNTFNEIQAKTHESTLNKAIQKVIQVNTLPLFEILDQYIPSGQSIDFMSIDVEGLDYEVLCTNNWERYSPQVILVEDIGASIQDVLQSQIYEFLTSKGYFFISKTFHTTIYQKQ